MQVVQLIKSVRWIEEFVNKPDKGSAKAPQLLAPLAALLRSRGASIQISASSSQSILESVSTRVEEAREITRYIVNLLIFLGLLEHSTVWQQRASTCRNNKIASSSRG